MKRNLHRILRGTALLLAMAVAVVLFVPVSGTAPGAAHPAAAQQLKLRPFIHRGSDGPSKDDLKGASSKLQYPNKNNWLDDYETRYVESTNGGGIYLCYRRGEDAFSILEDGTEVTVLARQGKNSLVITEYGEIGWCLSSNLVTSSRSSSTGSRPSKDDLKGASSKLQHPNKNNWLDDYETRYVESTNGGGIYLCYRRGENAFSILEDGTEVTVLARQGKNSLVITEYGEIGWCLSSNLVTSSRSSSTGSRPSKDDLKGASSKLQYPNKNNWLDDYETRYVESTNGGGIYLCYRRGEDAFSILEDGTEVTVLARQGKNSLVITEYGEIGWCLSSHLVK